MTYELHNYLPDDYRETIEKQLSRNDLEIYKLKTASGWKTLDSPYDPTKEAENLVLSLKKEQPVILLGLGSGYLLEKLEKKIKSPVLAITGSSKLAEINATISSSFSNISELNIYAVSNIKRVGDSIKQFCSQNENIVLIIHPREKIAYPGLFVQLEVLIKSQLTLVPINQKFTSPTKKRKVLFPTSGGLFEPEAKREFEAQGLEVIEIPSICGRSLTVEQSWKLIETHKPDFVFSTDNQASDRLAILPEICEQSNIPWVTWMLDDPRFVLTKDECDGQALNRIGMQWDKNGLTGWNELGLKKAFPLPLCTDISKFNPGQGILNLKSCVVFVGSPMFSRAKGYFAALASDEIAVDIAKILSDEIEILRKPPRGDRINKLIIELKAEDHFSVESIRRLPAFAVQYANFKYRQKMISSLKALYPIVYGDGWEGLLPEEIELRGRVDYDRELPNIYRSDAIHISLTNLQMCSYPNQRVFDVGACGNIVVNDKLEGWEELFGSEFNDLVVNDTSQMMYIVSSLVSNSQRRREMGVALHELIIRKHTISQRVSDILEIVKE